MAGDHRYYHVSPRIWEKPWSEDARYLALYLLSCRHRTLEGLFKLSKAYIADDLGWTAERLAQPFADLVADDFIRYDEQAKVVMIVKALEYQAPQNPNQVKAAIRKLDDIPETPLLADLLDAAQSLAQRSGKQFHEQFAQAVWQRIANTPTSYSYSNSNSEGAARVPAREGSPASPPSDGADAPTPDPEEAPDVLVESVHAAMATAGIAPSDRTWRQRARRAVAALTDGGRQVVAEAAAWALRQEGRERAIQVDRLSACRFGLVVDAYRAVNAGAPPRASPNGRIPRTIANRQLLMDTYGWPPDVVDRIIAEEAQRLEGG